MLVRVVTEIVYFILNDSVVYFGKKYRNTRLIFYRFNKEFESYHLLKKKKLQLICAIKKNLGAVFLIKTRKIVIMF